MPVSLGLISSGAALIGASAVIAQASNMSRDYSARNSSGACLGSSAQPPIPLRRRADSAVVRRYIYRRHRIGLAASGTAASVGTSRCEECCRDLQGRAARTPLEGLRVVNEEKEGMRSPVAPRVASALACGGARGANRARAQRAADHAMLYERKSAAMRTGQGSAPRVPTGLA